MEDFIVERFSATEAATTPSEASAPQRAAICSEVPPPHIHSSFSETPSLKAALCSKDGVTADSEGGDEEDVLRRMQFALADDEGPHSLFRSLPAGASSPADSCLYTCGGRSAQGSSPSGVFPLKRPSSDETRTQNMGMGLAALMKLRERRRSEEQQIALCSVAKDEVTSKASSSAAPETVFSERVSTTSPAVFESAKLPSESAGQACSCTSSSVEAGTHVFSSERSLQQVPCPDSSEGVGGTAAQLGLQKLLSRVEAAALEDSLAIDRVASELHCRLQSFPQQGVGSALAARELTSVEQKLRWAVEALEADVAALQRHVALCKGATSKATLAKATCCPGIASDTPSACAEGGALEKNVKKKQEKQQQQEEEEQEDVSLDGQQHEAEEQRSRQRSFSGSFRSFNALAQRGVSLELQKAAFEGGGVWPASYRLALRAASCVSGARSLARGRRSRGPRGGMKDPEASRQNMPPIDALNLSASQIRAQCMLTSAEHKAVIAAASASAASAASALGSEVAAVAASSAGEALQPPVSHSSSSSSSSAFPSFSSSSSPPVSGAESLVRGPWLAAHEALVRSLSASNHEAAFSAGLPLLRDLAAVSCVHLRAPAPPSALAFAAAASASVKGHVASSVAAVQAASEGLKRLAANTLCEEAGVRRGPLWLEAQQTPEEEDEAFRAGEDKVRPAGVSPSSAEQLVLCLRREFIPMQWLKRLPFKCKAQVLLPTDGAQTETDSATDMPVLRLSRADGSATQDQRASVDVSTSSGSQGPLRLDEALRRLSAQQRWQDKALRTLRCELRDLSRGFSTRQLASLSACVASLGAAEVNAALDMELEASSSNSDSPAPCDEDAGESAHLPEKKPARINSSSSSDGASALRAEKLQRWFEGLQRLGLPAHFAVAVLAEAKLDWAAPLEGGDVSKVSNPEEDGPVSVDVPLELASLMPHPDEDPGVEVVFALPQKPPPAQPWRWNLRIEQQSLFALPSIDGVNPVASPESLRRVREAIASRKRRLHFFLQQQKAVCRSLYKGWRAWRRQQERRRAAKGDIFGWGVLPVRAIDHPSLLVALPAGFRQGNPKEPYENGSSRGTEEASSGERGGGSSRRAAEASRRTLRGEACNDRQRAKEEAANRESKRDWMQANFANLTGPGVFWRDSCLFTLGLSLRQRCERLDVGGGVLPIQLLEGDPDYAIFDWARECAYLCTATRVFQPAQEEAERKAVCVWAEAEARTFVEKFLMYPKNFEKIASYLDGKTTRDCVDFYYRFKFKFGLKRRLQELEDGARGRKKQRHGGSKQFRREELVAEAVAGLASDCTTEMMQSFNAQNLLPFDAFSDLLLHRDAIRRSLKDPLATRGQDWVDSDSDDAEVFVENLRDGYFLPASCRGLVAPGRVVTVPVDGSHVASWGGPQGSQHPREAVPGCVLFESPTSTKAPAAGFPSGELGESQSDEDATSSQLKTPPLFANRNFAAAAAASAGPLCLKFDQLDTLLTCIEAASRRFSGPDDDAPSYMTRSRSARSKPPISASSSSSGLPFVPVSATASSSILQAASGLPGATPVFFGNSESPQSPRARGQDALLLRLRGAVRTVQQQNGRMLGSASRVERRKCFAGTEETTVVSAGGPCLEATAAVSSGVSLQSSLPVSDDAVS